MEELKASYEDRLQQFSKIPVTRPMNLMSYTFFLSMKKPSDSRPGLILVTHKFGRRNTSSGTREGERKSERGLDKATRP